MAGFSQDLDGVTSLAPGAPPVNFILKIQSFPVLAGTQCQKYESEFESKGYRWKLVLYPHGNKSKNVNDHLSLYLGVSSTSSLPLDWEVFAVFKLFLLNQNNDNWVLPKANLEEKRFHALKQEWGFDYFLPLQEFYDPSRGYMVEENCVFGVEVSVIREKVTRKAEFLSMIREPLAPFKNIWPVINFSTSNTEFFDSSMFISGDQKWKLRLYPMGRRNGIGTHLSLYLALADPMNISPGTKIYAEFTLRIVDQIQGRHIAGIGHFWFSATAPETGWARFATLNYFNNPANGLLVKDSCIVEMEVIVRGKASPL